LLEVRLLWRSGVDGRRGEEGSGKLKRRLDMVVCVSSFLLGFWSVVSCWVVIVGVSARNQSVGLSVAEVVGVVVEGDSSLGCESRSVGRDRSVR
jgi:hypothetical protein